MKKMKLIFCLVLVGNLFVQAQNRSIQFEHGTWSEIKEKAAKENKMIFIDCYTSWCGPCKWMAKNTFTNDTVADYFNSTFVCAKFDMEKGEGVKLAETYWVNAYPTLLFVDAKGEMIHRIAGALDKEALIEVAKIAQTPSKTYSSLVKKYNEGDKSPAFILEYLGATAGNALPTNEIAKSYFATQKEEDLMSRNNWTIIRDYLEDYKSREFKYLQTNQEGFSKLYTKDSVSEKINGVYSNTCINVIYASKSDKLAYLKLKEEIVKGGAQNTDKIFALTDLTYYEVQNDWKNYASTAEKIVTDKIISDPHGLNNICWSFYENVTDKLMLEKAIAWSKTASDMVKEDFAIRDTYACLLFKSGKKKEAIAEQEAMIALVKSNPDKFSDVDVKQMEEQIEKWRKAK